MANFTNFTTSSNETELEPPILSCFEKHNFEIGYDENNNLIICNSLFNTMSIVIDASALLVAVSVLLYSFITIKKRNLKSFVKLDYLLLLTELFWVLKCLGFFLSSLTMIYLVDLVDTWPYGMGWAIYDSISLLSTIFNCLSAFLFEILVIERFWFIAGNFYNLKLFYWILLGLSGLINFYGLITGAMYFCCWLIFDISYTTPQVCIDNDMEFGSFTRNSAVVMVWYKSILDTVLSLWIIYLLLNIKKISNVLKRKNDQSWFGLKLEKFKKDMIKFLLFWLMIIWGILILYTINYNGEGASTVYSADADSNNMIVNLVLCLLNFLRGFEVLIYFHYMRTIRKLVLIGNGQLELSDGAVVNNTACVPNSDSSKVSSIPSSI